MNVLKILTLLIVCILFAVPIATWWTDLIFGKKSRE